MLKPYELYNLIIGSNYEKHGKDVDYVIKKDEENKKVYVLFLGSNSKQDWKSNFNFWPKPAKPYKNMKKRWYAHRGFVEAYQSIQRNLLTEISTIKANNPDYDILIAGHSFGGAIAQLCFEDCLYNSSLKSAYKFLCITYGSPKVIYSRWKRKQLKRFFIINYENGSDIVPKLPPFAKVVDKMHIGESFNFFKCFTDKYHTGYGDSDLYGGCKYDHY